MSSPTDRREQRIARFRVGDAQRALAAAKGIVALAGIAFHALEERQDHFRPHPMDPTEHQRRPETAAAWWQLRQWHLVDRERL